MMMDKTPLPTRPPHIHRTHEPVNEPVSLEPADHKSGPADKASPLDRLINDRYRLLGHRGNGRLGAIYEAVDEQTSMAGAERHVAVQMLDGNLIASRRFTGEFERGVNSLQGLAHPNLVGLLDAGRDDGRFFIVMELQDSASLRFVLDDAGKLPLEETTAVVRAVGDALRYLHAKSFVHGNVKPENVLVTFDYEVRLRDVVPPEWPAALNGEPDQRDDVYGLACLAYEMLSGRHPFNANTPEEALRAGLEPAPLALLSTSQWQALAAALDLQSELRTPTIVQFLHELGVTGDEKLRTIVAGGAAVNADPVSAGTPAPAESPDIPLPQRVVRVEPARPRNAGRLLTLLLLVILGAIAYLFQDRLIEEGSALLASISASLMQDVPRTPAPPADVAPQPSVPPLTTLIEAPAIAAAQHDVPAAPVEIPAPAAATTDAPAPGPARFDFSQPVLTVSESDVAARIVIHRSGNTAQRASIVWWTAGESAVADQDFADLGRRVERFAPGETMRVVFVPLTNDTVAETVKSFYVYLGRADGSDITEPQSGMRIDIIDDD